MKKGLLFSLIALAIVFQSCKPEEQLRVESVIAPYDCYANCEVFDLVAQGNPTILLDTSILYVTRPLQDENGYVAMLGDEVYLNKDLSFNKSLVDYSLTGEFDGNGGLLIYTDIVDQQAKTRTKCTYTCKRQ